MSLALEKKNADQAKAKREKQMDRVLAENSIADDENHSKREYLVKQFEQPIALENSIALAGPDPLLWGNVFSADEVIKLTTWVVAKKKDQIEERTGQAIDVDELKKAAGLDEAKGKEENAIEEDVIPLLKKCKIQ